MSASVSQASIHLRHRVPLDFDSLNYEAPSDSPLVSSWLGSEYVESSFPVIDLDSPSAEESLVSACELWGMFIVTNHGIPSEVLKGAEAEAFRFFLLPREEKMKVLRNPGETFGYGMAPLAAIVDDAMWQEGFAMSRSLIKPCEAGLALRLHEVLEYQKRMKTLSEKILGLILKKYGGIPEFGESAPSTALQLNSYPACQCPNEMIGLVPHTDASYITIVHQNDVMGLQLFHEQHGWISVPRKTDSLVVNVGDMLHIMTNGRFGTSLHRVAASRTEHRISFAFFYIPPPDFEVSPIASGSDQVVKYRPVTKREFAIIKSKNINALSSIAIA